MSLQIERQLFIQERIQQAHTVKVEELALELDVSANTIRRDLTVLEQQGILKRTQGGAVFITDSQTTGRQSFDVRSIKHLAEKTVIGQYAAGLIKPGSTIILDAGTTTQQVAEHLNGIENIVVTTNSIEVGYTLMSCPNITVILSGGILLSSSRSLTGLPAETFFSHIHADQLFLATCGVSLEKGLTNRNMHEISVKQKMIEVAKEVILLADHEKFGKVALSPFAPLRCLHKIITDEHTPQDVIHSLEARGIEVLVAIE